VIVACPACDARYDLAGRPVGARAKCRCGTVFTIQAPTAEAATLACPHCGGAVPPGAASCPFCRTPLLVKACPRCLARVFHGYKHCPECGAELEVAAEPAAVPPGDAPAGAPAPVASGAPRFCPRCEAELIAHLLGDIALDDCPQCGGTFLDRPTLERLLGERREARADAILGAYGPGGDEPLPRPAGPLYVKCPDCRTVMNRKQFARGAKVVVDVCREHGTWFDAHELSRVVRFVMQGGLDRAAKAELADEREAARRALADARFARAEALRDTSDHFSNGATLADILLELWR
jgi:Zn-finger nucleic acid-binding protein